MNSPLQPPPIQTPTDNVAATQQMLAAQANYTYARQMLAVQQHQTIVGAQHQPSSLGMPSHSSAATAPFMSPPPMMTIQQQFHQQNSLASVALRGGVSTPQQQQRIMPDIPRTVAYAYAQQADAVPQASLSAQRHNQQVPFTHSLLIPSSFLADGVVPILPPNIPGLLESSFVSPIAADPVQRQLTRTSNSENITVLKREDSGSSLSGALGLLTSARRLSISQNSASHSDERGTGEEQYSDDEDAEGTYSSFDESIKGGSVGASVSSTSGGAKKKKRTAVDESVDIGHIVENLRRELCELTGDPNNPEAAKRDKPTMNTEIDQNVTDPKEKVKLQRRLRSQILRQTTSWLRTEKLRLEAAIAREKSKRNTSQ
jgi:hypothetical protein